MNRNSPLAAAGRRSELSATRAQRAVDVVEATIVRELLSHADPRLVLEIGTGDGRLTNVIESSAEHYVGIDVNLRRLRETRTRLSSAGTGDLLLADIRRSPLRDQAFSTVLLVRLLHRFPSPELILNQLARLLSPGGQLILSIEARPTVGSLTFDIWSHLKGRPDAGSVTFARSSLAVIRSTEAPGYVATRPTLRSAIASAGFSVLETRGTGLEELPGLRRMPAAVFANASRLLGGFPGIPRDFLRLKRGPG